jgi:predicted  nucleic acid-binding Zn-ribbon protein
MNEEELKIEIGKIKKKISKKSDKYGDWYIWNNKLEVLQAELKGIQEGKVQRDKEVEELQEAVNIWAKDFADKDIELREYKKDISGKIDNWAKKQVTKPSPLTYDLNELKQQISKDLGEVKK